ncbi:hypothetical protein K1X76_10930 [bacterium]|nr:hypothetical protein [bacterium]
MHTACSQGEDTPYNLLPADGDEEATPTPDEDCADNEFVTADCVEFEQDLADE